MLDRILSRLAYIGYFRCHCAMLMQDGVRSSVRTGRKNIMVMYVIHGHEPNMSRIIGRRGMPCIVVCGRWSRMERRYGYGPYGELEGLLGGRGLNVDDQVKTDGVGMGIGMAIISWYAKENVDLHPADNSLQVHTSTRAEHRAWVSRTHDKRKHGRDPYQS